MDEDTIIKPPRPMAYINRPYVFKSEEEFHEFVENIKTKDLDALYKKVKSIWRKYVDADDFHISICAADTKESNRTWYLRVYAQVYGLALSEG